MYKEAKHMTQTKKRVFISALLAVFAAMIALFFITFNSNKTSALSTQSLLSDDEGLTITYNTTGPSIDNGKTGIKLTSAEAGKKGTVTLTGFQGKFELMYRGYSIDENQEQLLDIDEIRFDFINKVDAFDSFQVRVGDYTNMYNSKQYGLMHQVWHKEINNVQPLFHYTPGLTSQSNLQFMRVFDTSFRNRPDYNGFGNIAGISFDPATMELKYISGAKSYHLVDFNDVEDMKKNFAGSDVVDDMSLFDVVITVYPVEGKKANVMLYELNGESLGSSTIADTAGPALVNPVNNPSGVVGADYPIDTSAWKMYDLVDGLTSFNGTLTVTNPSGTIIPVTNGKFVPTVKGAHVLNVTPVDSKGNAGEVTYVDFSVLASYPAPEFELAYAISDNVVLGDVAKLPGASFYSPLAGQYDGIIVPGARIYADGVLIKDVADASSTFKVDFGGKSEISVVYYAKDYLGNEKVSDTFVVKSNSADYDIPDMKTTVVVGEYIYADDVAGLTHEIISPSGKSYTYERVLLNQVGIWTVNYYYGNSVYSQYIEGVETIQSLWKTKLGLTIANKVEQTESYNRTIKTGAVFSSSTPYSGAEFKNVINVSGYTEANTILEWFTVPKVKGTNEFKQLNVYMKDLNDSSRDITVEFYLPPYYEWNNMAMRVYVGDRMVKENFYLRHTSFYGEWRKSGADASQYNNTPVEMGIDYVNKYLFFRNDHEQNGISLVDPALMGVGKEWPGFTNDEMKLSLEFAFITGATSLMIREVDGLSFTKDIVTDTVAPQISVDYDPTNVPKALVGKKFPIMSSYAMDSVDGRLNNVTATVAFLEGGRVYDYPVDSDNSFTPSAAGTYQITYTSTDLSGNTGSRRIDIQAYNTLDALDIDIRNQLSDLYPSEIQLGDKFVVYPANGKGGSGNVTTSVVVKDGNTVVELDDVYAVPTKVTNNLKVVYTLKDYLGQTAEIVVPINVVRSASAVFSNVKLPSAVIVDKDFNIPVPKAYYANESGALSELPVTVKINGENYTGATYMPTVAGSFTVQYVTAQGSSEVYTIKAIQPVVFDEDGYVAYEPGFLAKFFDMSEGLSINSTDDSYDWMIFNVETDSSMLFLNPQSALKTTVQFTVQHKFVLDDKGNITYDDAGNAIVDTENTFNYIGKINFTFTNVENPDEKIVLSVHKDNNPAQTAGLVTINGRETVSLPGNFATYSPQGVSIGFDGNKIVGIDNEVITTVNQTYDGAKFNGFTSEKVYVEISFEDVEKASEFRLISFNDSQGFYYNEDADYYAPILIMDREIVLGTYGELYEMPNMRIEDVLDGSVSSTMTVTSPSGKQIYKGVVEGFKSFTPNEYGTYRIKITCYDSSDNFADISENVKILNTDNVDVSIQGVVPEIVNHGDTVAIPALINLPADATSFIYLITPGGYRIVPDANNEFVANEYGNYKLFYMVRSSSGVINVQSYIIKVK